MFFKIHRSITILWVAYWARQLLHGAIAVQKSSIGTNVLKDYKLLSTEPLRQLERWSSNLAEKILLLCCYKESRLSCLPLTYSLIWLARFETRLHLPRWLFTRLLVLGLNLLWFFYLIIARKITVRYTSCNEDIEFLNTFFIMQKWQRQSSTFT